MAGRFPTIDAWSMAAVEGFLEPLWATFNALLDWLCDLTIRGFESLRRRPKP